MHSLRSKDKPFSFKFEDIIFVVNKTELGYDYAYTNLITYHWFSFMNAALKWRAVGGQVSIGD